MDSISVVFIGIYIFLSSAIILGNGLVMFTVFTTKSLWNLSNVIMASLALADLLVGAVTLPMRISEVQLYSWTKTIEYCRVSYCLSLLNLSGSILNLSALAIDRYYAIHYPFKYNSLVLRKRKLTVLVISIWFTATLVAFLPLLGWGSNGASGNRKATGICKFSETLDVQYLLFYQLTIVCVSGFAITYLYLKIYSTARLHMKTIASQRRTNEQGITITSSESVDPAPPNPVKEIRTPTQQKRRILRHDKRRDSIPVALISMEKEKLASLRSLDAISPRQNRKVNFGKSKVAPLDYAKQVASNSFVASLSGSLKSDNTTELWMFDKRLSPEDRLFAKRHSTGQFKNDIGFRRESNPGYDVKMLHRAGHFNNVINNNTEIKNSSSDQCLQIHDLEKDNEPVRKVNRTSSITIKGDIGEEEDLQRREKIFLSQSRRVSLGHGYWNQAAQCDSVNGSLTLLVPHSAGTRNSLYDATQPQRLKGKSKKTFIMEMKAAKVIALVIGLFYLCWIPFTVGVAITVFCLPCINPAIVLVTSAMVFANSAINPIVYYARFKVYREALRKMFGKVKQRMNLSSQNNSKN